jgi:hypothetical protein
MQTGIKAVDSLVPIGRGQRELIIGDRQTGYAMYSQTCRNGHLLITVTPLPMGTSLSTALIPVCIGSFTEIRGIIPGAFTPTLALVSVPNGP